MPTYDSLPTFTREFAKLSPQQQKAFLAAVAMFRADLEQHKSFRKSLRVKKMQGYDYVWEITWAPDGRATFHYGDEIIEGHPHIVWRRIGTHHIFHQP